MSPLASLTAQLAARSADPELASVRRFREAWGRRQATVHVERALERQPANAGPLNSHALVLQAFALLHELSPEYLRRTVDMLDALDALGRAGTAARPGKPDSRKSAAGRRRQP